MWLCQYVFGAGFKLEIGNGFEGVIHSFYWDDNYNDASTALAFSAPCKKNGVVGDCPFNLY